MSANIPEPQRRPGVWYAVTDNGLELPVVDVTNPAFFEEHSASELEALSAATLRNLEKTKWIPLFVHRALARKSLLLRGTLEAMGGILSGMSTYMLKIGPENLSSAYAVPLDRKIASALAPVAMRMRLRTTAGALAEGIADRLHHSPHRPVHLFNIAGGTGIDSINALLLLAHEEAALLRGTPVSLDILDNDATAPRFGLRAVERLMQAGAPLHGMALYAQHLHYDWRDVASLDAILREAMTEHPIVAISSEGGLFEYGSDEDIAANLDCLGQYTGADCFIAATAIKDVPIARLNRERSNMPLRISHPEDLSNLAQRAGWTLELMGDGNPMYQVFTLVREDALSRTHFTHAASPRSSSAGTAIWQRRRPPSAS